MSSPFSVIIPVGPGETSLGRLAGDLLLLPHACDIILVGCEALPHPEFTQLTKRLINHHVRWINAPAGRGRQLNAGARVARYPRLWFLHVDSGFDPQTLCRLESGWRQYPDDLTYCQLAFAPDGAGLMGMNQFGANWRSRWLGIPFGDQGFQISACRYRQLHGYREDVAYGEDHLFVWQARRSGLGVHCCGGVLQTSARKYALKGWWSLTLTYQYLWIRQAIPQFIALLFTPRNHTTTEGSQNLASKKNRCDSRRS